MSDYKPTGNYWCCKAEFGEHEPTCENYEPVEAPAPAQPTTVVHVPIPEGNESRYVEVLREQSQATAYTGPTAVNPWDKPKMAYGNIGPQAAQLVAHSDGIGGACPGCEDCRPQLVAEPSDNDTINKLRTTLKACRMKFLDYVDIHQENGNVDKAKSNQRMVDLCTKTLQESQATLPPSSSGPAEPSVKAQALREEAERIEGTHPGVAYGLRNRASELSAAPSSSGLPKMPMGEAAPKEWPAPDYKREAKALTPSSSGREMDCDCPCDICAIGTGKHCGNPPCDVPPSSGLRVDEIALIARKYFPATAQVPTQSYDQQQCLAAITEALSQQAGRTELEQAPRFNEKKHIERMVAAGCAIDFDPITLDLIVTNERADSLSLLLREVGETLTEHEWKPCMDSTAQKIHCKRCPACRRINEHAPNCWLSPLLTRLSSETKEEK